MDFFVSLLPQIPNLILLVVAALTLVFLVVFARKYQASQKGLGEAIKGLESKLGNHNGRDPRDLDPIFAKQPLLHIWNEYSDIHGAQILPNGARRGGLVALADLAANAASHLACS